MWRRPSSPVDQIRALSASDRLRIRDTIYNLKPDESPLTLRPGEGLLEVTMTHNRDTPPTKMLHRNIPVAAVDGEAVASGFGTFEIARPEGQCTVEIIDSSGAHSWSGTVSATKPVRLVLGRNPEDGIDPTSRLGPSETSSLESPERTFGLGSTLGFVVVGFVVALVVHVLLITLMIASTGEVNQTYITPVSIALGPVGVPIFMWWRHKRKLLVEDHLSARVITMPVAQPLQLPDKRTYLLPHFDTPLPTPTGAEGAICIDVLPIRAHASYFRIRRELHDVWTPAPRILLNGEEVANIWGRLWLTAPPGENHVSVEQVAADKRAIPLAQNPQSTHTKSLEVTVMPRETTSVTYRPTFGYGLRRGHVSYSEPDLTLKRGAIPV